LSVPANTPNWISVGRLVAAPALLLTAWEGATAVFLSLFALGLASDVADGMIARRYRLESELGARLDQWADFALWLAFPLGVWWLWPELIAREAPYVVIAIVCLLLPTAVAYAKYREVPGYHTWTAKLGSVMMGLSVPLLLLFDFPWPFRITALYQVICAIDELGITYFSDTCRHDVPSLLHAARDRRAREARSGSA
jgi:CDP-diacylglycerol---glycerol-3-phosphate 3-phosphatidyltransferase